jgi:hypothetical protein
MPKYCFHTLRVPLRLILADVFRMGQGNKIVNVEHSIAASLVQPLEGSWPIEIRVGYVNEGTI